MKLEVGISQLYFISVNLNIVLPKSEIEVVLWHLSSISAAVWHINCLGKWY